MTDFGLGWKVLNHTYYNNVRHLLLYVRVGSDVTFCELNPWGIFCKYCNKLLSEFSVRFPNYFMASLFLFLRYTRKFAISALIMMKELCCGSRGSTDNFNLCHEVKVL